MGSWPALDLRYVPTPESALPDLLYAALDDLEPSAIEDDEEGAGLRVFFRTASARDQALSALGAAFGSRLAGISPVEVDDEDWARRSQANLTAVRAGRLLIVPPWDPLAARVNSRRPTPNSQLPTPTASAKASASPPKRYARRWNSPLPSSSCSEDIVIVIEPSMGFGTGHHATTRLCLELLQTLAVEGRRVIDVGTGSGVLALAAAALGAACVVAVDHDPDALRNARDNAALNACDRRLEVRHADLGDLPLQPADIVLANLTGAVLERFALALRSLVTRGGALVVSGFSPAELPAVASAVGGRVVRDLRDADWCAAVIDVH